MTVGELRHWLAEVCNEREADADCCVMVETHDGTFQEAAGNPRPRVKLVDGMRVLVIELEW